MRDFSYRQFLVTVISAISILAVIYLAIQPENSLASVTNFGWVLTKLINRL
ncbi:MULTISPECIES: hypothetical protein [Klebsiella/Raoultella group]|uniref:hypothetical protein n=1 Tax=Klebsiella/Raoultella group TaxID=2890311 RepID=UPI00265AC673|nr:hypothetical protein [Klebsiella pneumoniae]WKF92143.1 hypothetical protein QY481_29665 [Klebsiella pneumoniae]HDT6531147.1 hypothetical protein [Raoultella ornithinolytica]